MSKGVNHHHALYKIIEAECNEYNLLQSAQSLQQTRSLLTCLDPQVQRALLHGLLSIHSQLREPWMVDAIIRFTKEYQFFKKYSSKHQECARFLRIAHFPSKAEIVEYQSDPDEFFFILQGEAMVFLKKTVVEIELEKSSRKQQPDAIDPTDDQDKHYLSKVHMQGEIAKFKKISVIGEGASFGELGILYNRPRIALIVAKTECSMAILNKEHYLSIFCQVENQERKFKRDFIFGNFFAKFNELKYELCQAILYSFREHRLSINQWIFREGDLFDGCYLIRSGEAALTKMVVDPKNGQPRIKQISIVSKGYFLSYEEWRQTIESGAPCKLAYSAKVSSTELKVYKLSYSEMLKIYNFKSILKEVSNNMSYVKYLQQRQSGETAVNKQKEQLMKATNAAEGSGNIYHIKQKLVQERKIETNIRTLMLGSLLGCDRAKLQTSKPVQGKMAHLNSESVVVNKLGRVNRLSKVSDSDVNTIKNAPRSTAEKGFLSKRRTDGNDQNLSEEFQETGQPLIFVSTCSQNKPKAQNSMHKYNPSECLMVPTTRQEISNYTESEPRSSQPILKSLKGSLLPEMNSTDGKGKNRSSNNNIIRPSLSIFLGLR